MTLHRGIDEKELKRLERMAPTLKLVAHQKQELELLWKTINKIDDFFEYTNESVKDREFIHATLEELTNRIVELKKVINVQVYLP